MTAHPINTEALRATAEATIEEHGPLAWPDIPSADLLVLLDALAAAEHRATRAEAQSAIRGRAVVMYRERARKADGEIEAWRKQYEYDTDRLWDELDAADARIKVVERLALAADDGTEYEHNGHDPAEGEAECPGCWALGIRRALGGDA